MNTSAMLDPVERRSSLHIRNNGNQNRYTRRQEQRRNIDSLISSERQELIRREPTVDEVLQMQKGIQDNKVSEFGLLRLSSLNLNVCYDIGNESGPCSLLRYAISHGRDKIAMALIRAGAQPILCTPEQKRIIRTFRELHPQYAVWLMVFEQARRSSSTICDLCSTTPTECVQFDKCGHKVCLSCFWVRVKDLDGLESHIPCMLSNLTIWDGILDPIVCCLSCGNQTHDKTTQRKCHSILALPSQECNRASFEQFQSLPTSHSSQAGKGSADAGKTKSKKDRALKGMHLSELARCSPGTTHAQRQEEFVKACMKADLRRVAALIETGVHLDGTDEYGMTALMQAVWLGHVHVCALLLAAGTDVHIRDPLGHTARSIAIGTGDNTILQLLSKVHDTNDGDDSEVYCTDADETGNLFSDRLPEVIFVGENGLTQSLYAIYEKCFRLTLKPSETDNTLQPCGASTTEPVLSVLIPPESTQAEYESAQVFWRDHGVKGAEPGAFCADYCFDEAFLQCLLDVFARLPVAPSEKLHCASRSYFCDVEARFTQRLEQVVGLAMNVCFGGNHNNTDADCHDADTAASASPLSNYVKVFPQMRFLHYEAEGTALAPHVDLARHDPREVHKKSTHTFILYLSDCDVGGGETVLLKSLCKKEKNTLSASAGTASDIVNTSSASLDENTIAAVSPRRGRLLLFPHNCPHEGRAITSKDPKLLLRGEVYIG